jgi:hypothetical protein
MGCVVNGRLVSRSMVAALLCGPLLAFAQTVYKCPADPIKHTPPLYTDAMSAKEANDRGCKPIENAPITVIEGVKPRRSVASAAPSYSASGNRVDPADQRARDSDSRRILSDELAREQDRLDAALKEYNNGAPERQGDERNYQKYIDRTADLKASIDRRQSDIEAIKREIAKLPS